MKDFQITRYLKKYWAVIAICSLLTGILFYTIAKWKIQEYTAATVIEYINPEAEEGLAPDGTTIDPTEIYGPNIIIETMEKLDLDPTGFAMDAFRSRIQVEPFAVEEEETDTEEKTIPTKYLITFSSGVSQGKEYPRKVLNQILESYFAYYGGKYVSSARSENSISDIYTKDYDYIEMAEVIDGTLGKTLDVLKQKNETDPAFRSIGTGYSFDDLYDEFDFIRKTELPELTADILLHTVTKDKNTLLAKYRNRKNSLASANGAYSAQTERIQGLLSSYEDAIGQFEHDSMNTEELDGNESTPYNDVLPDVYEESGQTAEDGTSQTPTEQTTEYDKLINEYSENRTSQEYNNLESDYNQYIIDVFDQAPAESDEKQQKEIRKRFETLTKKTDSLYKLLDKTCDEYEDFLGAQNLVLLASVGVSEKFSLGTYTLMIVVIFGVFGCFGFILAGRIGDFVEYYSFTDKSTKLPNKAKCDRYIAALDKKMLPSEFACIVLKVMNMNDEDILIGQGISEQVIQRFADVLTSIFVPSEKVFVGYNGGGQYLIFAEGAGRKRIDMALEQLEAVIYQDEQIGSGIDYKTGSACADEEKCYYIRKLLSMAIGQLNSVNG